MSEAKHTPGPWECDGDLVHKDGFEIAIVEAHYEDYVELQQANARLIAAAPDLLEALKVMVYLEESNLRGEDDEDVCDELLFARAAISKATGASA